MDSTEVVRQENQVEMPIERSQETRLLEREKQEDEYRKPHPVGLIRGRVVWDRPLPADAVPEIALLGSSGGRTGQIASQLVVDDMTLDAQAATEPAQYNEITRVRIPMNGEFEFRRVPGIGKYRLQVMGDYAYGKPWDFDVGSAQDPGDERVLIQAKIGAHITLQFLLPSGAIEEDGRPLHGRTLHFETDRSDGFSGDYTIDTDLRVSVPAWPAAWLCLDYSHDVSRKDVNLAPFSLQATPRNKVSAGKREHLSLQLVRGYSLHGWVKDEKSNPLSGVDVFTEWRHAGGMTRLNAYSDSDGYFELNGLSTEITEVTAQEWLHNTYRLEGDELHEAFRSGQPLHLVLASGLKLSGQLLAPDGKPVTKAVLSLRPLGPLGRAVSYSPARMEDGHFELVGLELEDYILSAAGWLDAESQELAGEAPEGISAPRLVASIQLDRVNLLDGKPVTLQLVEGLSVQGTVVNGGSEGLVDCRVLYALNPFVVRLKAKPHAVSGHFVGATSPSPIDGRFEIRDLAPGKYTLWAITGSGRSQRLSGDAQVSVTTSIRDVQLTIPAE